MKTTLTIQEDKFLINGQYTYSEIKDTRYAGFLMNARFIRLAALYPEQIDYVEFYRNGELYDTAYDEVYMVHAVVNYYQLPVMNVQDGEIWRAVIHLGDCSTVTCEAVAGE